MPSDQTILMSNNSDSNSKMSSKTCHYTDCSISTITQNYNNIIRNSQPSCLGYLRQKMCSALWCVYVVEGNVGRSCRNDVHRQKSAFRGPILTTHYQNLSRVIRHRGDLLRLIPRHSAAITGSASDATMHKGPKVYISSVRSNETPGHRHARPGICNTSNLNVDFIQT